MITQKEADTFQLYNHPEIYDIAFSWDLGEEIRFFKRIFETHVPFPVKRVLEPACGTGRMLRALAGAGFQVTGYDDNPVMVQYAKDSIGSGCEECPHDACRYGIR